VSVPIWICLTIWWVWNTYYANAAHTRDIHRLLCWVPIIEVIHGVLSLFNYLSCPWGTILSLVYATFWSIVTILKEPVLLLCLLLVAKGWGVTRHALHRREVCVSGLVLALLYASVSVQMSLQQTILAQVPMIIMYVVMLIEIGWSIHSNLRILNGQLLALRSLLHAADVATTPVAKKHRMYLWLAGAVVLYATLELIIHSVFSAEWHDRYFPFFILCHQGMEVAVSLIIGFHFRSRPLTVATSQVVAVATELADQMLPSITTIEVKMDVVNGQPAQAPSHCGDHIALRADGRTNDSRLPPTVIVLNPGDQEVPQPPRTPARTGSSGRTPFLGVGLLGDAAASTRTVGARGQGASGVSSGSAARIAAAPQLSQLLPPSIPDLPDLGESAPAAVGGREGSLGDRSEIVSALGDQSESTTAFLSYFCRG